MNLKNAWYRVRLRIGDALVGLLPQRMVTGLADLCLKVRLKLQERQRQLVAKAAQTLPAQIVSHDGDEALNRFVLSRNPPWSRIPIQECPVPGMLTKSEKQYYQYITNFYSGEGAVVEVGTWLGMSTFYLVHALRQNPKFQGPLYCFDDYVWRESMTKWISDHDLQAPSLYESFLPLFEDGLSKSTIQADVVATVAKVADYFGNEEIPFIQWEKGPIELLIVDCGRTLEVNEGWFQALSPSFIPGRTLIVMQDWQNHKVVPERFWENTKIFTDAHANCLDMVHEVAGAGIATFLFKSSN